jgi:hypothetical protein
MSDKPRKKSRPVGETIGGIIVGFDQQIMRTLPPPHELVLKGAPVRGLSADDGGSLEITFPPDLLPEAITGQDAPVEAEAEETDDAADDATGGETDDGGRT